MSRNPCLTEAMERFLCAIRDSDDQYAIEEKKELWVDVERFNRRTLYSCLRLCLVKDARYASEGIHLYELTECGEKALKDPRYVPLIVSALRGAAEQEKK